MLSVPLRVYPAVGMLLQFLSSPRATESRVVQSGILRLRP
jgi:hypothetical protein